MGDVRWLCPRGEPKLSKRLAAELGISPITAQVLINRGIRDADSATQYLHPSLSELKAPPDVPCLNQAVEVLARVASDHEPVAVYGDYDVDGVCGTALLLKLFVLLGVPTSYYIPDRVEEGYGLNAAALEELRERGCRTVVTVDCGTTAVREAERAVELGMKLVITDHHQPGEELPQASALVNPHISPSEGFEPVLSGVGVAFKLGYSLLNRLGKSESAQARTFLSDALALVALGTVADVVPLRGENRLLTQFGLVVLRQTPMAGLQALISVSGLSGRSLTAEDLAFRLGPRINAAGRLGNASLALELLVTASPERAKEIATRLDRTNRERQRIEAGILKQAKQEMEGISLSSLHAIVLSHPEWHPGVIGIVASRLADEYYRPVVLISERPEVCQGSARSIPAFHIFEALRACADTLLSFGGHAQAAGLRLREDRLGDFRRLFAEEARRSLSADDLIPAVTLDAEVSLPELSLPLVEELQRLAPFGAGNPPPVLGAHGVTVGGEPRRLGREGKHLSFYVRQGDGAFRVIAFGKGELADELSRCDSLDLAFTPQVNSYRGTDSVELNARHIRCHCQ